MAVFRNYDPLQVSFSFMGARISGYCDDTFIEVEREEDAFTKHVGSLGDVTRVRNLNRSGSVTLTLMAEAPSNDILTALAIADEQFGEEFGPLLIMDHNGNMEVFSSTAWIKKMPKIERGKESGTVVWEFECADLEIIAGGQVI